MGEEIQRFLTKSQEPVMPKDLHFAQALQEIVDKKPEQGLFARCFAESDGDEAKTKAQYIKRRAEQIEEYENLLKRQQEEMARKQEEDRRKKEQEARDAHKYETFVKEYKGEIPLKYYDHRQRKTMFEEWVKRKTNSNH
jgi:hypothetical protein